MILFQILDISNDTIAASNEGEILNETLSIQWTAQDSEDGTDPFFSQFIFI